MKIRFGSNADERREGDFRLRVDWPACKARGLCAELLPEAIELDEWGYPLLAAALPADVIGAAKAAVDACPTLALRLVRTR